jgi:hypothetical protein
MPIGKPKKHKLLNIDQIQAEFIIAGGRLILYETTKLINCKEEEIRKKCLRNGRS